MELALIFGVLVGMIVLLVAIFYYTNRNWKEIVNIHNKLSNINAQLIIIRDRLYKLEYKSNYQSCNTENIQKKGSRKNV